VYGYALTSSLLTNKPFSAWEFCSQMAQSSSQEVSRFLSPYDGGAEGSMGSETPGDGDMDGGLGPKRLRERHTKTRTGCLTCRFVEIDMIGDCFLLKAWNRMRRIKCDEEKPSCKRCMKSGWPCEYPAVESTTPPPRTIRELLPRNSPRIPLNTVRTRTGPAFDQR
jgi:hypothetical protein